MMGTLLCLELAVTDGGGVSWKHKNLSGQLKVKEAIEQISR